MFIKWFYQKIQFKRITEIFFLVSLVSACTPKKAQKDATLALSLKKVNSVTSLSSLALADSSSTLTVSSLKMPLRGLILENSGSGARAEIYKCAADSNDGCLIEMSTSAQLTDLLGAAEVKVKVGSFDTIALYSCIDEAGYTSFANATITDGTTTFYTHANGKVDTDSTDAGAISILSSGCVTKFRLQAEIAFTEKQAANLQFYFDSRNMVWMGLSKTSPGWYASGCTGDFDWDGAVDEAFICVAPMDLVGTVETGTPIIERYLLNTLGIVGIYFNGDGVTVGDGKVIGGYTRRYYEPGFDPASLAVSDIFTPTTPLRLFAINADSTMTLESYYGNAPKPGYLNISNFQRTAVGLSHSGVFLNENGASGSYTAERLD
jgi:hypothetical protein